jgi:cystinosin
MDKQIPNTENLASIIGWTYFTFWSIGFYPQIILNYRLKNTNGLSLDFIFLNIFGFVSYCIFTISFYSSPQLISEFCIIIGTCPIIQIQDVFFGLHGLVMLFIILFQFKLYQNNEFETRVLKFNFLVLVPFLVGIIFGSILSLIYMSLFYVIYACFPIKIFISVIKYIPQLIHNYKRSSTKGWSIINICLDFTGGSLSIIQLLMITNTTDSNPLKFYLGIITIFFDVLFILQHFYYKNRSDEEYVELP